MRFALGLLTGCLFAVAGPGPIPAAPAEHYPDPEFPSGVTVDRTEVELGQAFTISASLVNANTFDFGRGQGRILLSFPGLTGPEDDVRVDDAGSSEGDATGYVELTPGNIVYCGDGTAPYLVVEYEDDDWTSMETNTLRVSVVPPETGVFVFDVRGTMRGPGDPCGVSLSTVPPNGEAGFVDASGAPVKRFTVTVKSPTATDPISWSGIKARHP